METELPDLVLLDIWMADTDGRDVCKRLKQKT
jgi:CheY-like chemotaxis protein